MGNTMEVGVVNEWFIDEGERVEEGEPVAEIESEKTTAEITAEQDGMLVTINVTEGEEVPPGTRLGIIGRPDKELEEASSKATDDDLSSTDQNEVETGSPMMTSTSTNSTTSSSAPDRLPAAPGARKLANKEGVPLERIEGSGPDGAVLIADVESRLTADSQLPATASEDSTRTFATPSTRLLAREHGVDLEHVAGTGIGGRVTAADVRKASEIETATQLAYSPPSPREKAEQMNVTVTGEKELSGMRATIARRMEASARDKPHVTLKRDVPVSRALAAIDELGDDEFGLTDLLVVVSVEALETHPQFNAWYGDETLTLIDEINIGFAVDVDDGLVTPILRDAARKSPLELAAEREELTETVLKGKFDADDIQGGTFTISNLGMFGVDSFDPIINPPEISILGVGRIQDGNGDPEITLSFSFDHRVADGADAARFLETIVDGLSTPTKMIMNRSQKALERQ